MKFIALVSGGKDSIYSICKLLDAGHTLEGLLYMKSTEAYSDSYMFQTVGSEAVRLIGECLNCPLFIYDTQCRPINQSLDYVSTLGDEVEDLYDAIKNISDVVNFEAVCSGAILSNYQKKRVENICSRLGRTSIAPLWGKNQEELLNEMVEYGIDAIIVKIASPLLKRSCLSMSLSQIGDYFKTVSSKYGLNHCGEGGEYETVVLDCKYFKKRIRPKHASVLCHPEEKDKDGSVFYLELHDLVLEDKGC